jgi:hypothetical protein
VQIVITDPANPGVQHRRYVEKHRRLWEEANGPIPADMRLKCRSNNKTNCDPSNWTLVSCREINRLRDREDDGSPEELKPSILAVTKLENRVRTRAIAQNERAGRHLHR